MIPFEHQLLGAWRSLGLDAAPRPDGSITFCCPKCVAPTRVEVADGVALCTACAWGATGEPWTIAAAAREAADKNGGSNASHGTNMATGADCGRAPLPCVPSDPSVPSSSPSPPGLPLLDLDAILDYTPNAREEIWPGGILTAGMPAGLVGAPGVGKSRLSLQAALATILGWKFLGWETRGEGLKWLFLQTENSTRRLKGDLGAMTSHLSAANRAKVQAQLRILNVMALDFASICMLDGHPDRLRILETLEDWQPDVVVVDPLRDAGRGDPNKDGDMTETCRGISSAVRHSNPRRAMLIVHHGRTGAQEASRVFGDDAASFARNSKVLYGWLRSQINIAPAGIAHPDVIIAGCGKCSDGPRWDPFAARLDPGTMTYRRLEPCEFDLDAWSEEMGSGGTQRKRPLPSPEQVAAVVRKAGGEVRGGVNSPEGLIARVAREFQITRPEAISTVEAAVESSALRATDKPAESSHGGGRPTRSYTLNPDKFYEKK